MKGKVCKNVFLASVLPDNDAVAIIPWFNKLLFFKNNKASLLISKSSCVVRVDLFKLKAEKAERFKLDFSANFLLSI